MWSYNIDFPIQVSTLTSAPPPLARPSHSAVSITGRLSLPIHLKPVPWPTRSLPTLVSERVSQKNSHHLTVSWINCKSTTEKFKFLRRICSASVILKHSFISSILICMQTAMTLTLRCFTCAMLSFLCLTASAMFCFAVNVRKQNVHNSSVMYSVTQLFFVLPFLLFNFHLPLLHLIDRENKRLDLHF